MNNAAYVALLRASHDLAVVESGGALPRVGRVHSLEIAYLGQVVPDEPVQVAIRRLSGPGPFLPVSYVMEAHGRTVVTAAVEWQPERGSLEAGGEDPAADTDATFRFRHEVRSYEVGTDGTVRARVILEWLEHAVFRAAARVGWTVERMEGEDFVTLVVGHRLRTSTTVPPDA